MQQLGERSRSRIGLTPNLSLTQLLLGESSSIRVEAEKHLLVLKRVLLLGEGTLGNGTATDGAEHGLDFRGVDDLAEIGLLHDGRGEEEVLLEGRGLGGGAIDLVEGSESRGSPDDEAAEVAAGGELEEVEGVDGGGLNTGDVAESESELLAILVGVVDDEGAATLAVTTASELTLTSAELAGVGNLLDIGTGSDLLEERDGGGSLGDGTVGEGSGGDDEGDLRDGGDVVAAGHQQSGAGGGSESRGSSETLLAKVDLDVPLAPDLGGSEHTTGTALITEGSLAGTVGSSTRDTRNTGNGTTSSPGLGGSLMTSLLGAVGVVRYCGHPKWNSMGTYTAYGWRRFLFMPVWTVWTISGRMGAWIPC